MLVGYLRSGPGKALNQKDMATRILTLLSREERKKRSGLTSQEREG